MPFVLKNEIWNKQDKEQKVDCLYDLTIADSKLNVINSALHQHKADDPSVSLLLHVTEDG